MQFRKYNFIVQLIYYLFFNFFCLQALKANQDFNIKIPENNLEDNLELPNLKEDLYLLGTGDTIRFSVIGAPELNIQTRILNDGNAIIPFLGPVKLSGLTILSASRYLENLLSKELINPKVELFISENRPIKISIIGEVLRPGIYNLNSLTNDLPTIITAIEEAGGISKFADLTKITLKRKLPGEYTSFKKSSFTKSTNNYFYWDVNSWRD